MTATLHDAHPVLSKYLFQGFQFSKARCLTRFGKIENMVFHIKSKNEKLSYNLQVWVLNTKRYNNLERRVKYG
jgi:hypothetical protein